MPPKREPSTRTVSSRPQSTTAAGSSRTRTRAQPAQPSRATRTAAPSNDVEIIAENLASKLTLRGKQRVTTSNVSNSEPKEDVCVTAMRTVNTVSKQLSALIEKPSSKYTFKVSQAQNALEVLRKNGKGVDVERAASSLVGKLVTLGKVRSRSWFYPIY